RVKDDQPADAADDQHHHRAERVDEQLQADVEVARLEPRPRGGDLPVVPRGAAHAEEGPDRAAEGDEHTGRRDPGGCGPGEPRPPQQDQDRADEPREQADPRSSGHPRSSERVSTSSERSRRFSATTRPSPTQTSEATTANTESAKTWPAPLCQ